MRCSVLPVMPRVKDKKKKTEPEPEADVVETESHNEQNNLVNPNIEEYLPKPQTEWFHMVIKAQVKKVIQQSMEDQQREFTEQLEQFKKSIIKEIQELKETSLKNIEKACHNRTENIESEFTKLKDTEKRERFKLEATFHEKQQKVQDLKLKMDSFEQGQLKSSIQIVGLPENEDDTKAIMKLGKEKLGVKIKSADIGKITRLGKMQRSGKPRNLVVNFTNESTRNQVYKERKKLITNKDPQRNIYINDRLTEHRQNVFYAARKLVKGGKIFAAWSQAGNILIRKTKNSKIIQVESHEKLRESVEDQLSRIAEQENNSDTLTHLSDYSFEYESDL